MSEPSAKKCLGCGAPLRVAGPSEQCDECGGALLSADNLLKLYLEVRDDAHVDSLPLEGIESAAPERSCPGCETLMTRVCLEGVELDYCAGHGFWFDPKELEAVLECASGDKPCAEKTGFWKGTLERFVQPEEPVRRYRRDSVAPWLWLKK